MIAAPPWARSRVVATWLTLLGGSLGLHRLYLHGTGDRWFWLFPWPTLAGAYGFWRLRELGTDDALGAMLVPLLGVMVAASMLLAIVYGLMPAERWQARFGGGAAAAATGWATISAVIIALAAGAIVAMATIAFSADRYLGRVATATPGASRTATG